MERLSLAEMFSKLFDYLGKNPLFIMIFAIFILVYFYLILSPVYTKRHKITYTIFFIIAMISLIVIYGSEFWKFFDYLMDNIFLGLFFPNLTIYMTMVVTTIIIFLITMFSKKMSGLVKKINTAAFLLIIFFLVLSLNIVMTKNVNVYSQLAVYSNEPLLVMIQMTMIIFAIWLIALGIIKIINSLSQSEDTIAEKDEEEVEEKVNDNQVQNEISTDTYNPEKEFAPIIDTPIHPYINKNSENINNVNDEQIIADNVKKDETNTNPTANEFSSDEYKLLHQYLEDMKNQNVDETENTK